MKYHAVNRVFQKRCYFYLHPLFRKNFSKRIHAVHRKTIEMKPWIRFANSTAGSVDSRSKFPKLAEPLKTTAKWKDLVSIFWKLSQEKKVIPVSVVKRNSVSTENGDTSKVGLVDPSVLSFKARPILKDDVNKENVVIPERVKRVDESNPPFKSNVGISDGDDSTRSSAACSNNHRTQTIEAENSRFKIIARHLPGSILGISLNLRSKENLFKSVTSAVQKENKSKQDTDQMNPSESSDLPADAFKDKPTTVIPKPRFRASTLRESCDSRTRYLMRAVATSGSLASRSMRLQEFCNHLCENPPAKNLAVKERAIPLMLRLRIITPEPSIQALINEALALLGYSHPLPGHGIRILAIDGGGTRGIMAIEILRALERMAQQPIHRLFDFMCGVSTGSILSVLLGALKVPMDECEELYKHTSTEIFNQSTLWGTGKLVLNHAFYDTDGWVKVLRKNIGDMPLIQTSRDPTSPKIAAISTVVSEPRLQNFIFRNYDYPHRGRSHFLGSYTPELWEAVRASAAAPGYFEEYKLGKYVHQDGGILTNNPTALAIHECRHLWPGEEIQCVVSIGNGRYEPGVQMLPTYSSLKTKIMRIVDSATDTEMVHTILSDLLPPSRYFRINPYLTESISLDEIRPEKFKQLKDDAKMYIRKNESKVKQAAQVLMEPKGQFQKLRDSIKLKIMTYL